MSLEFGSSGLLVLREVRSRNGKLIRILSLVLNSNQPKRSGESSVCHQILRVNLHVMREECMSFRPVNIYIPIRPICASDSTPFADRLNRLWLLCFYSSFYFLTHKTPNDWTGSESVDTKERRQVTSESDEVMSRGLRLLRLYTQYLTI